MQIEYKEIYANDKPELNELVQEWIDENISNIYCKLNYFELEHKNR
ncbi:MAG TPA: hypothetical protein OIM45_01100 [Clostridiaceae bacterium]|nr:hypothetical protein [Clostridiaceae bacterium]